MTTTELGEWYRPPNDVIVARTVYIWGGKECEAFVFAPQNERAAEWLRARVLLQPGAHVERVWVSEDEEPGGRTSREGAAEIMRELWAAGFYVGVRA